MKLFPHIKIKKIVAPNKNYNHSLGSKSLSSANNSMELRVVLCSRESPGDSPCTNNKLCSLRQKTQTLTRRASTDKPLSLLLRARVRVASECIIFSDFNTSSIILVLQENWSSAAIWLAQDFTAGDSKLEARAWGSYSAFCVSLTCLICATYWLSHSDSTPGTGRGKWGKEKTMMCREAWRS